MNTIAERITVDPEQCGGRPCIRGMRIRVSDVLDLFAAGLSAHEILDEMPDLEAEDLQASLRFASSPGFSSWLSLRRSRCGSGSSLAAPSL